MFSCPRFLWQRVPLILRLQPKTGRRDSPPKEVNNVHLNWENKPASNIVQQFHFGIVQYLAKYHLENQFHAKTDQDT